MEYYADKVLQLRRTNVTTTTIFEDNFYVPTSFNSVTHPRHLSKLGHVFKTYHGPLIDVRHSHEMDTGY